MRLFLAAELPDALQRAVAQLQGVLREELRGWRWLRPTAVHLTLRFLGEVDEPLDQRARAAWREVVASHPPFALRATGPGRFPAHGRPRVLWVGVADTVPGGALATLAGALEAAARTQGWPAEPRPFRPHLTLARAMRGAAPDPPGADALPADAGGWVRRVTLHHSRLGPDGASYTALESFPLAGEP